MSCSPGDDLGLEGNILGCGNTSSVGHVIGEERDHHAVRSGDSNDSVGPCGSSNGVGSVTLTSDTESVAGSGNRGSGRGVRGSCDESRLEGTLGKIVVVEDTVHGILAGCVNAGNSVVGNPPVNLRAVPVTGLRWSTRSSGDLGWALEHALEEVSGSGFLGGEGRVVCSSQGVVFTGSGVERGILSICGSIISEEDSRVDGEFLSGEWSSSSISVVGEGTNISSLKAAGVPVCSVLSSGWPGQGADGSSTSRIGTLDGDREDGGLFSSDGSNVEVGRKETVGHILSGPFSVVELEFPVVQVGDRECGSSLSSGNVDEVCALGEASESLCSHKVLIGDGVTELSDLNITVVGWCSSSRASSAERVLVGGGEGEVDVDPADFIRASSVVSCPALSKPEQPVSSWFSSRSSDKNRVGAWAVDNSTASSVITCGWGSSGGSELSSGGGVEGVDGG